MSVQIDLELLTKQFQNGIARAIKASDSFAKEFEKNIDRNEKSMSGLAKSISNNTKSMSSSFSLASVAAGTFLGNLAFDVVTNSISLATNTLINFSKASLESAIDAEETRSKFSTIFRDISSEARDTASTLSESFGLGSTEARRLLGDTGDLLTGFGFSQKGALELSKSVQELAVDLASFTNFSGGAAGASSALTKALLGERESVKSLGISIQEKDVQEQIAINNAKGLTFETERQAKAQATLDIAIRQSQNAIGDYARTSNSAANQQRLLSTRINDIQEAVGRGLIPAFQAGLVEVNKFISTIDPQDLTKFVTDGVVIVIEGLIELTKFINPVVNGFKLIADSTLLTINAIRTAFNVVNQSVASFVDGFIGDIQKLINFLPDAVVPDSWKESIDNFKEATSETLQETVDSTNNSAGEMLKAFDSLTEGYTNSISEDSLNKIKSVLNRTKNAVKNSIQETINSPSVSSTQQNNQQNDLEIEKKRTLNASLVELERAKVNEIALINLTANTNRQDLDLIELTRLQDLENQKLEIIRDANLKKVQEEKDSSKRMLEIKKINSKFEIDSLQLSIKQSKERKDREKKDDDQRVSNRRQTLNTIASLSQSNNKTLATIGKAAAITTATQDGILAVQKALASAPPPFNFALAGLVGAATAANVAKISNAGNFTTGGIIEGTTTTGDRITANVNSGEMILNKRQQTQLFNQANGSSSGNGGMTIENIQNIVRETVSSMNVTLVANDNEIARSASRGAINGVVIGVSE